MARLIRCIEGHVFDAEASARCPVCGAAVELPPESAADAGPASAGPAVVPFANRQPLFWAIAGLGLALIVVAAVIFIRAETASPAGTAQAQNPPPHAEQSQTATANPVPPNPAPSDQRPASGSPAPSTPAAEPAQSGNKEQADLQPLSNPSSDTVNPLPSTPNSPFDAGAFKAGFADALSKLGALAPIDPTVANIATGIAGLNLFNRGAEETGQAMLQEAAAADISFAAAALGQQFFGGTKTLRQDYGQARQWFELASRTGDVPVANYELAVIYARGLAVKPDLKLAGHYFLAAYHGGFQPVVEIVAAARAGQRPQRELLHKLGIDPSQIGMTLLEYYDARRASDPAGALQAIEQLAKSAQWPAANILAMAQWNGDDGAADRAAAAKNFLAAASGGAFAALIPVSEASLDGTLGSPDPAQAGLVASLVRLYSQQQSAENLAKLDNVYHQALDQASPDQRAQLDSLGDLLSRVAPAGSEASVTAKSALSNP